MSDSTFFTYKKMRAATRTQLAKQNAKDAEAIVGISNHAVNTKDWELLHMAFTANNQPGHQIDALDEALNPDLGGAA